MNDKQNKLALLVLGISALLLVLGLLRKDWSSSGLDATLIAAIPKGTASMWWEVVHKGVDQAAGELGYQVSWQGPEQESDRDKQIDAVRDAITRRAGAVVLAPNDGTALMREARRVKAAGIPLVLIDSPLNDAREKKPIADTLVATDNYAGGVEAARLLGTALNGKGNVLLVKFIQNSISTDQRADGFKETLRKEFPGIVLLDEQYTAGSAEDAIARTEDMLTRHRGKVDGLFAVNQPTAIGAFKALESQKLSGQVRYIGFDADPVLLAPVADGRILALLVQNPYEIGYRGTQMADQLIKGKTVPARITVPTMTVTRENLEQVKREHPAALGL